MVLTLSSGCFGRFVALKIASPSERSPFSRPGEVRAPLGEPFSTSPAMCSRSALGLEVAWSFWRVG